MDIINIDRTYRCYCGTGEAFRFAYSVISKTRNSDDKKIKIAVVSDRIVSGYYYNRFEEQFLEKGIKPVLIPVECSENSKDISAVSVVYEYLADFGFGSDDWIVALGGGGILDVAGFAASSFSGGINFLAVPTTPSSMCEGAVSSFSFLNSGGYKNILSLPFNPDAVIIDPSLNSTVPDKIRHNGYAYVIKLAVLYDPGMLAGLLAGNMNREFLNRVYEVRKGIMMRSPGLLTLGDELADAIVGYFRFMNYSEGEALALSLLSCVDERIRESLIRIYEMLALPVRLHGVSPDSLINILKRNLERTGKESVEIVDISDSLPRRWQIKTVDVSEVCEIMRSRLEVIKPEVKT